MPGKQNNRPDAGVVLSSLLTVLEARYEVSIEATLQEETTKDSCLFFYNSCCSSLNKERKEK